MENNQKLKQQDNDLNDILKLTQNTNQNLQDGKENLAGQQVKIQLGIDNVKYLFLLNFYIFNKLYNNTYLYKL